MSAVPMRGARLSPDVAADVERVREAQPARTSRSAAIELLIRLGVLAWDAGERPVAREASTGGPRKAGKR